MVEAAVDERVGAAHDADWLAARPRRAYADAAAADRAAGRRPGALDTTVHTAVGDRQLAGV